MRPLEDFEVGWGDWSTDHGVWQVGVPTSGPAGAHSGSNVAATILDGNYPAQTDSRLISPVFSVPIVAGNEQVLLRYWQWFQYADDWGELQVSSKPKGGDTWSDWVTLPDTLVDGSSGGWQLGYVNLSALMGMDVRVAFYHRSGSSTASGWYIDDVTLTHLMPPSFKLGTLQTGTLKDGNDVHYYVIQIPAGGHLKVALDDLDDLGANELYIKHGSLPTAGDYDYKFSDFGSADQFIYVPDATPGYWFIMVKGSDVPPGGSEYTLLAEHSTGVILDSVTPDHYGAADGARLTLNGAGFTPGAKVELVLVGSGSVVATAATVEYYSGTRIVADFSLVELNPESDYFVRVRVEGSEGELPFTVMDPLPAQLKTNMILPSSVGYHRPATIWVEYENTGQIAMKAPLLVVGAKQLEQAGPREGAILTIPQVIPLTGALEAPQARGFWTSAMPEGYANTVQFLAGGEVPGLLQPGEKGRFPVYWAGWQQPWNFSYPPINFTLGVVEASNINTINWAEMKDSMKPDSLATDTWDALWQAFTAEAGSTWGSYVTMLQDNAIYLGRQGLYINDISDLLAFEFAQADGINVVRTLASSTDAHVVAPGLDITFSRSYGQSISGRHALGDLGYGWSHNWDYSLEFEADGTIRMKGPGGSRRTYQPDSRAGYPYFSMEGDHAVFISSGGGYLHTESSGYVRFFDSTGKLQYVGDTHGNRITCTYSGDQLVRLDHSSGQYLDIGWSSEQIVSVTDPDGRTTSCSYDGDYLTNSLFYDGSSVSYGYETSGTPARQHALLSVTFPGNTHQYFDWDANGRLSGISRDHGAEPISFSYGDAGEVYIQDVFGNTSSYFLNQNGVLVKAIDPQGDKINLKYDLDYNLAGVIDPAGRTYNYDYDSDGNMTRMTDPLGYVTRLSYTGPFDRLTALVDANGNITRYQYDEKGGLTSIAYDDESVESWTYDESGNPDSWTNRRGSAIGYEYDADGRLTAKVFTSGERTEYFWDSRGNLDYTVDASGTTDFTYDANDFLVRIDYPGGHWLAYAWNQAGQRTSLTNELGNVQYYHYDNVGRLASMTDEKDGLIVQYEYDAAGRLATKTLGNGVYTTYVYNAAWELVELSNRMPDDSVLSQFAYEYDSRGRRVAMTSTYGQADDPRTDYMGRWEYEYDDLGQLVAWQDPTGHRVEYQYDGLGNRVTVTEDGAVTDYTTNNLNQYTQVGGTTYTFDLDGNLVREDRADGSWTAYTYHDENRLVATETSAGELWEYEYNALGHRNRVTENGEAETHIVDPFGLGNLVGVHPTTTDPTVYVHGIGLTNQRTGISSEEWFTFDAIGSVQDLTLETGGSGQHFVYEPFGTSLKKSNSLESVFETLGLWGIQKEDQDILNVRARYFKTDIGRFVSTDPAGLFGGDPNLYSYCRNNPLTRVDVDGNSERIPAEQFFDVGDVLTVVNGDITTVYFRGVGIDNNIARWYTGLIKSADNYGKQGLEKRGLKSYDAESNYKYSPLGDIDVTKDSEEDSDLELKDDNSFKITDWKSDLSWKDEAGDNVSEVLGKEVPSSTTITIDSAGSGDPNLKTGTAGYGTANYVEAKRLLSYRIDFENESSATSAAQTVTISDPLNANLDWTTFTLTEVGFGDVVLNIPLDSHHYQTTVEMDRNGTNFEVKIDIGVNLGTGELYANFYSLDPITGLPPEADVGMLPPEDGTGRGMGWFSYTIETKSGLAAGTEIRNVAYIVFDGQPAIATNQVDPHDPSQGTDPEKETLVTIAPDEVSLTISASSGGSVTAPGSGTFSYPWATDVELQATPSSGYRFVEWTGDIAAIDDINAAETSIVAYDNFNITAVFAEGEPQVIYVDSLAEGSNDGTSWSNGYTELTTALADAGPGDEIWVAQGVYTPGSNRTDAFTLKNNVAVYGGFNGTETEREDRKWNANATILSGDIGIKDDVADNCYHVLFHPDGTDLDGTAILDGFVITGGNADGSGTDYLGGAMYNFSCSPTVVHCRFEYNSAGAGGAIYNDEYSAPIFSNTVFSNNEATDSGFGGGAVYNDNGSYLQMINCTLSQNRAETGGALYNNNAAIFITNSVLWGNSATNDPEIHNDNSYSTIEYSDIDQDGYEGEYGNIRQDPLFVDTDNGDYHLLQKSPCIDSGDPVELLVNDYYGGYELEVDAVTGIHPGDQIWITDNLNVEPDYVSGGSDTSILLETGFSKTYLVSDAPYVFTVYSDFSREPLPNGGRINIGAYGGTSEAAVIGFAVDGTCGIADDGDFASAPTSDLCKTGTASVLNTTETGWSWTCKGSDGGTDAACSANLRAEADVPSGNSVPVTPIPDVNLEFSSVVSPGTVTVTAVAGPGATVIVSGETEYHTVYGTSFDITTSASTQGPITVCIGYDPADVPVSENRLRLLRNADSLWEDITTAVDANNNQVCGQTTVLSSFVIGYREDLVPGDCNGDGQVSIAEVQGAINMYLGLKPTESCVDTDNSGNTSIAEVQKVINGYLGL